MATITQVQTPDGVIHNIGGGGGTPITYNIGFGSASSNTVPFVLTGSNGTTDTVYFKGAGDATLSVSGDTLTITTTGGQSVTYTLSGSGTANDYTITNTPSSGTASSATIPAATQSAAGVMTSSDKTKLDGIQSGAEVNVQADWSQSDNTADDYIKNKPTLATVATTGDYDDLTNKPNLATVATTGDYDDLTNKPTIPTVNDATLTIQKNGTDVETFTANSSTNKTANITVPTQASDIGAQEELVSGTNIKTINGTSILGSGNITTPDDDTTYSISETDGTLTLTGSDSSTSSVGVVTDVEVNGTSVVTDGVADITATGIPHVNLTQAQYDALSDADKNNGTIYFITDGQGTAEEIIGTGALTTTAQTLIGAVNELNDNLTVTNSSYVPTITGNTNLAYNNVNFTYTKMGRFLFISGRLQITNAGTGSNYLTISLPSGMTALNMGLGSCGVCTTSSATYRALSTRCTGGTTFIVQVGAGAYSLPDIGTGYVMVSALVFLTA